MSRAFAFYGSILASHSSTSIALLIKAKYSSGMSFFGANN